MEYYVDYSKEFSKSMKKLKKKNNLLFIQIKKKIKEIGTILNIISH